MIVYQATKAEFSSDVLSDRIEFRILEQFKRSIRKGGVNENEIRSWKNSMHYMDRVLHDSEIPDDCGVAIEYQLPQSGKRVDFILTGKDSQGADCAVLVELKQWSEASLTDQDGIVETRINRHLGAHPHPSYQAWSYASLLMNFNETIEKEKIRLAPCAYLHNYIEDEVIKHLHYKEYLDRAPVFLKGDALKLREFIKKYVKLGDKEKLIYRIDKGKIRPSKMLADSILAMLKGNEEFVMIDDQKVVFEAALSTANKATITKKKVLIVKGGPGTGKTVVAINLLATFTNKKKVAKYVSKNAAPRAVYESKLTGTIKKSVITNLFSGSGAFVMSNKNDFDALIVDEAHRLNEFSGLYSNLGENQIKEIINAAKTTIFFIDEDQCVTLNDIGTCKEIHRWAKRANAQIAEYELASQFRCNGSDGYLAWLDDILQIRETANKTLDGIDYDFQIYSSPTELKSAISEKNEVNNKSRLVAGYCWEWKSKNEPSKPDIVMAEFGFEMRWNLRTDGSLWIISPESINEIGCIHTCQGLELDYVGVIVGNDLIVRHGKVVTNPNARAKSDKSIKGYKRLLAESPGEAKARLDRIIKNTYRTLMTRGMKGCYVYFVDDETREYFRDNLSSSKATYTFPDEDTYSMAAEP